MSRLYLLLFFVSITMSQGYQAKVENRLKTLYGDSIKISFKKLNLNRDVKKNAEKQVKQYFFRSDLYTWKFELGNQTKFAMLDNVIGKVQPITFLVVFDAKQKIEHVEVLKYRESHGYEVGRKSFLQQFKGKTVESSFEVGEGLDGISGATISVNSMSRGVRKLGLILPFIVDQYL